MFAEPAIFLAALGITTLEMVEAAAVALALYAHSGRPAVFLYTALGIAVVFAPMFVLGALITLLPDFLVKLIGRDTAALLRAEAGQEREEGSPQREEGGQPRGALREGRDGDRVLGGGGGGLRGGHRPRRAPPQRLPVHGPRDGRRASEWWSSRRTRCAVR